MSSSPAIAQNFETPQSGTAAAGRFAQRGAPADFSQLVQQIANESIIKILATQPDSRTSAAQRVKATKQEEKPEQTSSAQLPAQPAPPIKDADAVDVAATPLRSTLADAALDMPLAPGSFGVFAQLGTKPVYLQAGEGPAIAPVEKVSAPAHAPAVTKPGATRQQKSGPVRPAENSTPAAIPVTVPMPVPVAPLPESNAEATDEGPRDEASVHLAATAPGAAMPDPGPAAVELKIRPQDQPVDNTQLSTAPGLHTAVSPPVLAAPEPALAPVGPAPLNANVVATASPAPVPQQTSVTKKEPPATAASHLAEPLLDPPKQPLQPLRSISLEFAPDGAEEVRVRLAEREGDVHISLHSTDSALAGRMADGVHDLVGTLANAGYDAQAWTSNQGRQNQRQAEEPRRNRRDGATEPGAEEFGAAMQQPIQEIS